MESKKFKATIKNITEKEPKTYGDNTFQVSKVELSNGHSPIFWSRGEFPFKKGNVIEYELDQKFNKGKLSYPHPKFEENEMSKNKDETKNQASVPMTQQESISRSVGWNNASQLIFTEEFQKHNVDKDDEGKKVMMSERQLKMLDQAILVSNLIYKQLLTKPE